MIQKTFASVFIWYEDWLQLSKNRWKTDIPCLKIWFIKSLEMDFIDWNASEIHDYKIWISPFWKNTESYIYSMGIFKNSQWDGIESAWLLEKIEGKNYIPELWDNIIAKINPENNYVNEIFLQNWKSLDQINDFLNTLKEPYCTWWVVKSETKKELVTNTTSEYQNFTFPIIIFLIIVIWVLIFKIYKLKK